MTKTWKLIRIKKISKTPDPIIFNWLFSTKNNKKAFVSEKPANLIITIMLHHQEIHRLSSLQHLCCDNLHK